MPIILRHLLAGTSEPPAPVTCADGSPTGCPLESAESGALQGLRSGHSSHGSRELRVDLRFGENCPCSSQAQAQTNSFRQCQNILKYYPILCSPQVPHLQMLQRSMHLCSVSISKARGDNTSRQPEEAHPHKGNQASQTTTPRGDRHNVSVTHGG